MHSVELLQVGWLHGAVLGLASQSWVGCVLARGCRQLVLANPSFPPGEQGCCHRAATSSNIAPCTFEVQSRSSEFR